MGRTWHNPAAAYYKERTVKYWGGGGLQPPKPPGSDAYNSYGPSGSSLSLTSSAELSLSSNAELGDVQSNPNY